MIFKTLSDTLQLFNISTLILSATKKLSGNNFSTLHAYNFCFICYQLGISTISLASRGFSFDKLHLVTVINVLFMLILFIYFFKFSVTSFFFLLFISFLVGCNAALNDCFSTINVLKDSRIPQNKKESSLAIVYFATDCGSVAASCLGVLFYYMCFDQ